MDREQYRKMQVEELVNILGVCCEFSQRKTTLELMQIFMDLSMDTFDELSKFTDKRLILGVANINPDCAGNYAKWTSYHKYMPAALVDLWLAWEKLYPEIIKINPLLEMHDLLSDWSERVDASSWPWDYEKDILEFVEKAEYPADRTDCIRLKQLRDMTNKWLYKDDEGKLFYRNL
jgi:hypothetical protein